MSIHAHEDFDLGMCPHIRTYMRMAIPSLNTTMSRLLFRFNKTQCVVVVLKPSSSEGVLNVSNVF